MADNQWLTEKHYLVCPKGMMFKQMKVNSQTEVVFSGNLAATTADTMNGSVFICVGSTAFAMGAAAGLACLLVPGVGWAMAAIIAAAALLAIGIGYMKCQAAAVSRIWVDSSPQLIIHGNQGLVVGQSKLNCVSEGVLIEIEETFWGAMMSTTLNNVGHISNFVFGFLAGRGAGTILQSIAGQGTKVAGLQLLSLAKGELGAMFNPASLVGKMSWLCRAMRGFGMYGAYKGQIDIWFDDNKTITDKLLASGAELVLSVIAAKGASTVCFPTGTLIHSANGLVPIERLNAGVMVWTMNEVSGEREMKPIIRMHRRVTVQMMVVELDNGLIFEATPEHRFFTNGSWVELSSARKFDKLELIDGGILTIKSIGLTTKYVTVFNFDVEDNQNYFVTEYGILVHNGYSGRATKINPGDAPENIRALNRENETAKTLSSKYDVEQNPTGDFGGKRPDYRINGVIYDCYSPSTSRVRNITTYIAESKIAKHQTKNVVVNLDDTSVSLAELSSNLKEFPIIGLENVMGIKNGEILQLYP